MMTRLENGEEKRIIKSSDAHTSYIIEVAGNPIRVGHRRGYTADRGTTLRVGQHTVSNLRGESLFAAAHDGDASLRINEAAADVDPHAEKDVTVIEGEVELASDLSIDDLPQDHYDKQDQMISLLQDIEANTSH